MNASTANLPIPTSRGAMGADRVGVIASVFCAIHCAATPLLLLFAPAFGKIWAHPASHWIAALLVVPLASVMVVRGFRVHRKRWIVATGLLGMAFIIAGAVIPYWPDADEAATASKEESALAATAEASSDGEVDGGVVAESGGNTTATGSELPAEECDSCCPSLVSNNEGETKLHIPTASIVTTLGGIALICTHLGNLCACRKRSATDGCESPFC